MKLKAFDKNIAVILPLYFIWGCILAPMSDGENQRALDRHDPNIVAGPGEKTFDQTYHVSLKLPIEEAKFLEVLKRLNLPYEVLGKKSGVVPPPWHREHFDTSQIRTTYQIYGKNDHARRIAQVYRAYVNKADQVVYIENIFMYYNVP
jgi:hypothetical protein